MYSAIDDRTRPVIYWHQMTISDINPLSIASIGHSKSSSMISTIMITVVNKVTFTM